MSKREKISPNMAKILLAMQLAMVLENMRRRTNLINRRFEEGANKFDIKLREKLIKK